MIGEKEGDLGKSPPPETDLSREAPTEANSAVTLVPGEEIKEPKVSAPPTEQVRDRDPDYVVLFSPAALTKRIEENRRLTSAVGAPDPYDNAEVSYIFAELGRHRQAAFAKLDTLFATQAGKDFRDAEEIRAFVLNSDFCDTFRGEKKSVEPGFLGALPVKHVLPETVKVQGQDRIVTVVFNLHPLSGNIIMGEEFGEILLSAV